MEWDTWTYYAVADPGEGLGGPAPLPLFLDQTEALRAEKTFLDKFFSISLYLDT